jgi:hypothetical protein
MQEGCARGCRGKTQVSQKVWRRRRRVVSSQAVGASAQQRRAARAANERALRAEGGRLHLHRTEEARAQPQPLGASHCGDRFCRCSSVSIRGLAGDGSAILGLRERWKERWKGEE